jgi:cytochrome P460
MKKAMLILTAWTVVMAASVAGAATKPTLPKGYEKWEKSTEKVVTDKNSPFYGIHYIYVDAKAMKGYKAGGSYAEGGRMVIEFFDIKDVGGKSTKGKKNMVVLMQKDKRQKQTGGWLFAGFTAEGKFNETLDPVKNCYECHLKEAKDRDFVISRFENFKK